MIISWDPGEARTGCCIFSYNEAERKANLMFMRILNTPQVYETLELAEKMLTNGGQHTFVIENFRADVMNIRGGNRGRNSAAMFQWDEMKTSQMIGTLTYAAYRMNKSKVVLQEPKDVLTMGRVWCDFPIPKKGHIPDDKSAYIHGAHYMMQAGMINTVDDIIKHGQEKLP